MFPFIFIRFFLSYLSPLPPSFSPPSPVISPPGTILDIEIRIPTVFLQTKAAHVHLLDSNKAELEEKYCSVHFFSTVFLLLQCWTELCCSDSLSLSWTALLCSAEINYTSVYFSFCKASVFQFFMYHNVMKNPGLISVKVLKTLRFSAV